MAAMGVQSGTSPTSVSDTLARLSARAGVTASMVMDRSLNTVLQTSGSFASFRSNDITRNATPAANIADSNTAKEDGVEEFAAMISKFVNSAVGLVHELDSEDDMKLLRLRTKKNELVIVPDTKYIFVVVHDTPPA